MLQRDISYLLTVLLVALLSISLLVSTFQLYTYRTSNISLARYNFQQIKRYSQRCLLAQIKAILYFSRIEFTCP